jgi:predicted PurR-regulated permease PerM
VINKSVLLLVVLFISAVFLSMIRQFLVTILLAGIFSSMIYPIYSKFEHWFRGRRSLASLTTLLLIIIFILLPLTGIMGIVTAQAIKVGRSVTPWVQKQISEPDAFFTTLESIPLIDKIIPYREIIFKKAGELVGSVSGFLIDSLSSATLGTVNFIFLSFVLIYCMYFFLMDGKRLVEKILYYLPMKDREEKKLLERFSSVTLATLKGTAVIGVLQGGIAGVAFAIILGLSGRPIKAIMLAAFCLLVVGSLDNLLRPRLVGKDTQMHELMIFFGTLGGIMMFGVVGFIIGPIIAALFITVWEIYGETFRDVLPEVRTFTSGSGKKEPGSQRDNID